MEYLGWMKDAACSGMDPDLFFHGPNTIQSVEARAACARCEVSEECLEFDLAHEDQWGMYGGVSEKERRAIKRRRDSAPVNTGRTALRSVS